MSLSRTLSATGLIRPTRRRGFCPACRFLFAGAGEQRGGEVELAPPAFSALAGVYGLTPLKRASEARCRELCALHGPLPFNLMRSAVFVGANYGLSCVGCSAALMVAMVLIGMSSLIWVVILGGVVLVYKLAPAPSMWQTLMLSAALGALAIVYA